MTSLTATIVLQTVILITGAQPYTEARSNAESIGQPLLVLVGADWCPACRTMKHTVLDRLEKNGKLDNVAYAVVNTDRESGLADRLMRGSSIPQLILYQQTPSGWQRSQLTGAQSESAVEAFLRRSAPPPSGVQSSATFAGGQ